MHNAVRVLLLFLAVMTGWAADPPPPLVRSVLTTNLPAFGNAGEVLTRQALAPYLTWTVPASGDAVLSNYVDGNFIRNHLGNGTNTTFWQSNVAIPPVVIKPVIGSTTNRLEVHDTNGVPKFVINSRGNTGIRTNLPQNPLHVVGPTAADAQVSPYIMQVENPMVANQTNTFVLLTNGNASFSGIVTNAGVKATGGNSVWADYIRNAAQQIGIWDDSAQGKLKIGSAARFVWNNGANDYSTSEFDAYRLAANSLGLSNASFTVKAANANANVVDFGTTNRPSLLTLTTNGVLSVNPGGGLNPVGCYGSLMMNATNIVVCAGAAGVYTNVAGTGYTTIETNGFYGSLSDALTNLYAGRYRVTVDASCLGQNNQATEWEVFTNGASCDLIRFKKTFDAAARMDSGSKTGIIYLPAGTRIDFRVQDAGTGGSISIHSASITIGTP